MEARLVTALDSALRPYQREGRDFLRDRQRAILADKKGLGKSLQALAALRKFPVLVICCETVAVGVWEDEIARWLPDATAITYRGRQDLQSLGEFDFLVTTIYWAREVLKWRKAWASIIIDESHKLRNRRAPTLYGVASAFRSSDMFELTGGPINNGLQDLWAQLNIARPDRYTSYWNWVKKHMYQIEDEGGRVGYEGVRNAAALKEELAEIMLRRTKSDVLPELPKKTRVPIPLEMSPAQARLYSQLSTDLEVELRDGGYLMVPNTISLLTRLRQLLVSPAVLGLEGESAMMKALREDLESHEGPAIIFCPFVMAFAEIQQAIHGVAEQVFEIRGGKDPAPIVRNFQRSKVDKRILLCSLKMGSSFTANAADTCFYVGYDPNPETMEQAEDRISGGLRAIKPTFHRYYIHRGTTDDWLMDILDGKTTIRQLALNPEALVRGRKA